MKWSPDGRFLAARPQDTSIIFVLCPQSTGASVNEPLCVFKNSLPSGSLPSNGHLDSTGLLVNLQYGMGIKYWRLDCKYPVHLFPYPKALERDDGMVFYKMENIWLFCIEEMLSIISPFINATIKAKIGTSTRKQSLNN